MRAVDLYYQLNPDGTVSPTTLEAWATEFADPGKRRLALDEVGPAMVSTIFLGLDHAMVPGTGPILFETLIRGADVNQEHIERYGTKARALEAHAWFVRELTDGKDVGTVINTWLSQSF